LLKTSNDFLHDLRLDHINFFQLEKYLRESRIISKLNGFLTLEESSEVTVHSDLGMDSFLFLLRESKGGEMENYRYIN